MGRTMQSTHRRWRLRLPRDWVREGVGGGPFPPVRASHEGPSRSHRKRDRELNARRGRILYVEAKDQTEQITAIVPMAELLTYATMLNLLTAGRGSYAMEFAGYDEVPRELAVRVIEAHKMETLAAAH